MDMIERQTEAGLSQEEWVQFLVARQRSADMRSPDDQALIRRVRQRYPMTIHAAINLGQVAIKHLVLKAGRSRQEQEVLWRSIAAQQYDLGYLTAPPLERLLIEQVLVNWVQLQLTQMEYTSVMAKAPTFNGSKYWERRLTAVQERYLRAIQQLARVRKLAVPTPLQVNIGGQQINMVGGNLPPPR